MGMQLPPGQPGDMQSGQSGHPQSPCRYFRRCLDGPPCTPPDPPPPAPIPSLLPACPQVQYAFLAGLGLVLLLIPINRVLAGRIQAASIKMMAAKDRWAPLQSLVAP